MNQSTLQKVCLLPKAPVSPKTASVSELSRGAVNPVIHLIFAIVQCDSSLPAIIIIIRQIEFTMHRAMLNAYEGDF